MSERIRDEINMGEILLSGEMRTAEVELTSARRAFWSATMVPCFAGSAISLAAGIFVSIISWSGAAVPSQHLAYCTIGLIFSAFILMFLGAHCMDRRDAAEKAEQLERRRREGLAIRER